MGWALKSLEKTAQRALRRLVFAHPVPRKCVTTPTWFAEQSDPAARYREMPSSDPGRLPAPKTADGWNPRFKRCESGQSVFVAHVPNARVYGKYGAVITSDNRLLGDVSHEFGMPCDDHSIMHLGRLPRPTSFAGNLAVLSAFGANGYFHFLFDVLPRLGLISEEHVDALYINRSERFQRDYLDLLGVPTSRVLPVGRATHVEATQIIAPSLPGPSGKVTRLSIDFLRGMAERVREKPLWGKRIYCSRGDVRHRAVANEGEVINLLQQFGFREARPGAVSVREQIAAFAGAEVIVAPHGGSLANLVYCRPGARVLEIFSASYVNPCYWRLAGRAEIEYWCLQCDAHQGPGNESLNPRDKMTVDIEKLRASVAAMLDTSR